MSRILDLSQARERHRHKRKEAKVSALRDALAAARGEQAADPVKEIKSFFKRDKEPSPPRRR